jgi:hypothetical protein
MVMGASLDAGHVVEVSYLIDYRRRQAELLILLLIVLEKVLSR